MTVRIALALGLALVAVVVAVVVERRSRRSATAPVAVRGEAPVQLFRSDFPRPTAPWLVVAFTSSSCGGCGPMVAKVEALECADVVTTEVEFTANRSLHERYAVDAVPLVVVADVDGVVRASWFGTVSATDLWAAVAELRHPGSTPNAHCDDH